MKLFTRIILSLISAGCSISILAAPPTAVSVFYKTPVPSSFLFQSTYAHSTSQCLYGSNQTGGVPVGYGSISYSAYLSIAPISTSYCSNSITWKINQYNQCLQTSIPNLKSAFIISGTNSKTSTITYNAQGSDITYSITLQGGSCPFVGAYDPDTGNTIQYTFAACGISTTPDSHGNSQIACCYTQDGTVNSDCGFQY